MTPQECAAAVHRGAGLFRLEHRGVVEVAGGDARRWLDGMVTNDVTSLAPGRSCPAVLLTPIGRVVADLLVVARPEGFWLELERSAIPAVLERLDRFIIADDVRLEDASERWARLAVEGPAAPRVVEGARPALEAAGAVEVDAGFGETARQLFVPAGSLDAVSAALREAGAGHGLVEGELAALEILRVEAGVPRLGRELDEEVLPLEARLDHAVAEQKGCYTGQEVIARIRSRGRVKHLLVGLRLEGDPPPEPGAPIEADGRRIGELTSVARSPSLGAIGLGFVQRPHQADGTEVRVAGAAARVAELPFLGGSA